MLKQLLSATINLNDRFLVRPGYQILSTANECSFTHSENSTMKEIMDLNRYNKIDC